MDIPFLAIGVSFVGGVSFSRLISRVFGRDRAEKEEAILWCLLRAPGGLSRRELRLLTGIGRGSLCMLLEHLEERFLISWDVIDTGYDDGMPRTVYYANAPIMNERCGKRCHDGDWIGDTEPGGMECVECECIFISNDGRPLCKVCHDERFHPSAREKP